MAPHDSFAISGSTKTNNTPSIYKDAIFASPQTKYAMISPGNGLRDVPARTADIHYGIFQNASKRLEHSA